MLITERVLDKFSIFLRNFVLGPISGPRGSFGAKKSAIDAENARESENSTKTKKKLGTTCFRPFPQMGKPGNLINIRSVQSTTSAEDINAAAG